jgi:hypothetical protein
MLKAPGCEPLPGVSLPLEICLHRRQAKSAGERPAASCSKVWGGLWDSDLDVEFKGVGVGSFAWRRQPAGIAAYIDGLADRKHDAIFALSSRAVSKSGRRKYVGFPAWLTPFFRFSRRQNRGSFRPNDIPRRRCSTRRPWCGGGSLWRRRTQLGEL